MEHIRGSLPLSIVKMEENRISKRGAEFPEIFFLLKRRFLFCFPTSTGPSLDHTQKENTSLIGGQNTFQIFHSDNKSEQPPHGHLRFDGCQRQRQRPQSRQGWGGPWEELSHPSVFRTELCGWNSRCPNFLPLCERASCFPAHGSLRLHGLDCSSSSPRNKSFVGMECLVNFGLRSA